MPAEVTKRLKAAVSADAVAEEPERAVPGERPTRQPPAAGRGK